MPTVDETALRQLVDRAEITDVQYRYALGTDSHDWQLFRSCFTEEVETDFSEVVGLPASRVNADEWVRSLAPTMESFTATHHAMSNVLITFIDDDHATCVAYVQARHHKPNSTGDSDQTVYGYYTNQYERTAGGWRIAKLKLSVRWMTGNFAIFAGTAQ
ncbi:nuclear transport factor 2 family protein [uncultured Jatrophihabitans sp.]|uniref:nuclear transport factor 2 family protein n=1 Tax=uncultured Jatrophihabitans sp. TaxID=1610747 RepID=UPI0035CB24CC